MHGVTEGRTPLVMAAEHRSFLRRVARVNSTTLLYLPTLTLGCRQGKRNPDR